MPENTPNHPSAEQLVESLAEALETAAFVSLAPSDSSADAPTDAVLVTIDYRTPDHGVIELVAPASLGQLLASNVLAVEPTDDEAVRDGPDALKELMNVTCGGLVSRATDAGNDQLEVGLPVITPFATDAWPTFAADANVFDADGHVIAVRLKAA